MTPSFPAHRSSGRGQWVLQAMHLRQESVSIAGGIVLFLIGLRMIFPTGEGLFGDNPEGEPFIVPMAIPMIAGPSGMAAVMRSEEHTSELQSLMRIPYAVFCLKKTKQKNNTT